MALGDQPSDATRRVPWLAIVLAVASAPRESSSRTAAVCPPRAAMISAVYPLCGRGGGRLSMTWASELSLKYSSDCACHDSHGALQSPPWPLKRTHRKLRSCIRRTTIECHASHWPRCRRVPLLGGQRRLAWGHAPAPSVAGCCTLNPTCRAPPIAQCASCSLKSPSLCLKNPADA